jgi:hypothetical protein
MSLEELEVFQEGVFEDFEVERGVLFSVALKFEI